MSESSKDNIPSDFPDIQEHITYAFGMYGINAVEKVVNDLAAEASAAEEFAKAIDDLETEKLSIRLPLGEFEKAYTIAFLLEETEYDSKLAKKRLQFAKNLLKSIVETQAIN